MKLLQMRIWLLVLFRTEWLLHKNHSLQYSFMPSNCYQIVMYYLELADLMNEYHATYNNRYFDGRNIILLGNEFMLCTIANTSFWYLFSDSYFYDCMKSFIPQFNNKALYVKSHRLVRVLFNFLINTELRKLYT